ncbi:hypothetical protein K4L44_17235 [Halosquirtibacter laminarini]|uniref:Uncharacterized protein n=1 Tax=Halosquirtibacter laminarini TaxID=3374600 RepID=A0AC61NPG1_9BACT|nr:hypothetical protein K4L44_17235 [Prolixibacteraceae bacterium]
MRYIKLTQDAVLKLTALYEHSDNKVERMRSHCLLLSNSHYSMVDISRIMGISVITVSRLFDKWLEYNFDALRIKQGRGAKCKLAGFDDIIKDLVKTNNRNLSSILHHLKEHYNLTISKETLIRFLKRSGMYGSESGDHSRQNGMI